MLFAEDRPLGDWIKTQRRAYKDPIEPKVEPNIEPKNIKQKLPKLSENAKAFMLEIELAEKVKEGKKQGAG
eukprot:961384-Ditylum_brightwellii.AAC.1